MEFKPWRIAVPKRSDAASGTAGQPGFFLAVQKARGLEAAGGEEGFVPYDPMLLPDMDKAVERVRRAVEEQEKILIFGDYDCDGVTATVILYDYLENAGADVLYYIPEREGEGYGMNRGAVEALHRQGVGLVVTVDNGISSIEEVGLARELGIDVVVTDHHRPHEELPQAAAGGTCAGAEVRA